MTTYAFRPATADDLDAVIALRTEAEDWLRAAGIEQWTADYHDMARDVLRTAVERGVAWVVVDGGTVVATVTLNGPDLDFWQPADAPDTGLYLSKMIVARGHAGRGLGAAILNWAAGRAGWAGKEWLRLECRRDNLLLHAYYQAHGFAHLRTVKPPHRRTQSGALFQRAAGTIQTGTLPRTGQPTSSEETR
jgi:GNAT superfamily N-acetyltransferase